MKPLDSGVPLPIPRGDSGPAGGHEVGLFVAHGGPALGPGQSVRSLFHLAINVRDLDEARRFYGGVLGCAEGRSTETWVDFDFFGHQLSLHLGPLLRTQCTGRVADQLVPMPHFGLVLALDDWRALAQRLEAAGTAFVLPPQLRFEGQPGEQWTMFFHDPSGNPIEVKGFRSLDALYSS